MDSDKANLSREAAFVVTNCNQLEQSLQPDEQMWIDVGKLIREQVPDKNGKFLPQDLTSGSYQFRDLTDKFIGSLKAKSSCNTRRPS